MFNRPLSIYSLWLYGLWLLFFCALTVFAITQLSGEPIFNSEGFIRRSKNSILELSFYTSNRPFTTDFFYKIWGSEPYQVVVGQKIFSVFSWTFLGLAISCTIHNPILKLLSLTTFSSIALWWNVGGWNNVIRSESLSFSFFALWYGVALLFKQTKSSKLFVLLIPVTVFFSFTRDNIPYFLLLFIMLTIIYFFVNKEAELSKRQWIIYIVIVLIVSILQSVSAQIGKRHQFPLINVIFKRILTYDDRIDFFKSRGMPVDNEFILKWKDQWASGHNWELFKNPKYNPFMEFTLHKGKYVYGAFLLTHLGYSIKSAWKDRKEIMSKNLYDYTNHPPLEFLVQICSGFWNTLTNLIKKQLLLLICLVSLLIARREVFPLIAAICILFNGFFIYHADAMEVQRHNLIVLIVLAAVSVHLFFVLTDLLYNKAKSVKHRTEEG